jgi:hypothetical protein
MPELQKAYDQTKGSGVQLLGIDVRDEVRSAPADFVRDTGITYPSIYDPPGGGSGVVRLPVLPAAGPRLSRLPRGPGRRHPTPRQHRRRATLRVSGRWRVAGAAAPLRGWPIMLVLFVLGFTVVFASTTMAVLGLSDAMLVNEQLLQRLGGVITIVMGLVFLGAFPVLQRGMRPRHTPATAGGALRWRRRLRPGLDAVSRPDAGRSDRAGQRNPGRPHHGAGTAPDRGLPPRARAAVHPARARGTLGRRRHGSSRKGKSGWGR